MEGLSFAALVASNGSQHMDWKKNSQLEFAIQWAQQVSNQIGVMIWLLAVNDIAQD